MTFLEKIKMGKVLVGDGAWGTMLFNRGLAQGDCPELFNLTHPEVIEEVAQLYIDAGAELITTNTFGGSPLKLSDYDLDHKVFEINSEAVRIVKEIVPVDVFVSGSVGPSGRMLLPYGDSEPEEIFEGFKKQIGALIEAKADLICIETMMDLQEALLAVKATRELSANIPLAVTMTFDKTPKGYFTMMGVSIENAANSLSETGADILGSNCGNGIDKMIEIAKEFNNVTDKYLLIQSNAGMPLMKDGGLHYPESPDYFGEKTVELIEAGVSIIGGCCGSTPDHIKAIRCVVDSYQRK